uniref:SIR2 family protein n=1 Tax=Myxococcus vastator TaxID=2709664 RepID=UPI0013D37F8D
MTNWKEQLLREQFERKTPTLLLGSGTSISTGISLGLSTNFPGMPALAKRFYENISDSGFSKEDQQAWASFKQSFDALGAEWWNFNLEGFLTTHPLLTESVLLRQIREHTAEALIAPHESLAKRLETDPRVAYPLRTLLDRLLRSAPATHPELTVVTPNYDLLVEYSADLLNVPCLTGFTGGILRQWRPEIGFSPPKILGGPGQKSPQIRRVRLIKPHGSTAWYQSTNEPNLIIEQFSTRTPHGNWNRCMIAPGPSKYAEALMNVCRDHMQLMDNAFKNAQFLVIVGYGFNDRHLEEHLKRSLDRGMAAVYATREISEQALNTFVRPYQNVTCITSNGTPNGSRVYSGAHEWHLP